MHCNRLPKSLFYILVLAGTVITPLLAKARRALCHQADKELNQDSGE
jgi:hypothetical protein